MGVKKNAPHAAPRDTDAGTKLAKMRLRRSMTQKEAAEKIGANQVLLSRWERGVSSPHASRLAQLAELYKCSIDELI